MVSLRSDDTSLRGNLDVVVVGGGPAGLSAVRACVESQLSCALFDERAELGGQLLDINHPIGDYLGLPVPSGVELARAFARHAANTPARLHIRQPVLRIDAKRRCVTTQRTRINAGQLVLAMGARARALHVPGEAEHTHPGDRAGLPRGIIAGSRVVVVGGGDNAAEVALHCADRGASVTLLVRRDMRAARHRQQAVERHPQIQLRRCASVQSLSSGGVWIEGRARLLIPADRVLVRIGYAPNSELVRGQVEVDDAGRILADRETLRVRPGVAAAGDLVSPTAQTGIAIAVSQGALAVRRTV